MQRREKKQKLLKTFALTNRILTLNEKINKNEPKKNQQRTKNKPETKQKQTKTNQK